MDALAAFRPSYHASNRGFATQITTCHQFIVHAITAQCPRCPATPCPKQHAIAHPIGGPWSDSNSSEPGSERGRASSCAGGCGLFTFTRVLLSPLTRSQHQSFPVSPFLQLHVSIIQLFSFRQQFVKRIVVLAKCIETFEHSYCLSRRAGSDAERKVLSMRDVSLPNAACARQGPLDHNANGPAKDLGLCNPR
jgi:hypothetical protein